MGHLTTSPLGPTMSRRRLRLELRRLRIANGLELDDVCRPMDWSIAKAVRIESGVVNISPSDLKFLLHLYKVHDPEVLAHYKELNRAARVHHWAGSYRKFLSQAYMDMIGYDDDATTISEYHPYLIPSLVQTVEYATLVRTAAPSPTNPPESVDARAELVMARQRRVLKSDCAVTVLVDRRALKRLSDSGVTRRQMQHLIESTPRVELRVLPYISTNPLVGAFAVHSFDTGDSDLAHLHPGPDDVSPINDDVTSSCYASLFRRLCEDSVGGDSAVKIVSRALAYS